jgi:hypothetical protein
MREVTFSGLKKLSSSRRYWSSAKIENLNLGTEEFA